MNDSTNSYINLMKHCIGLDRKKPYRRHGNLFYKPYRNYYETGNDRERWELLIDEEYAKRDKEGVYHLTREGMDWLGRQMGIYIHDKDI